MNDTARCPTHSESIVIDAVCPLVSENPKYLEWYREGGVTALAPTVGGTESAREALGLVARWQELLRERDDLCLVRRAGDVVEAKRSGRLGIFFHFQGTDPLESSLELVDAFKALGVGVIQLTYNVRNRVGDGCEEKSDAGLSRFGARLIERMNRARVIVDCSHTGARTSLEAIECSSAPVVLSHSNVAAVHRSARNVGAELIQAVARSGGLIGVVGFPAMVAPSARPSTDDLIRHIDAIVEQVGIDHVALGLDYYAGQAGVSSDESALQAYLENVRSGLWSDAYPRPPYHYPAGIETPRTLANLTLRLMERGYSDEQIRKILGGNWLRVMRRVWGD